MINGFSKQPPKITSAALQLLCAGGNINKKETWNTPVIATLQSAQPSVQVTFKIAPYVREEAFNRYIVQLKDGTEKNFIHREKVLAVSFEMAFLGCIPIEYLKLQQAFEDR